ncbi:hypothetical protein RA280_45780, partial [Cupriavidus sp. CV2]|uniref:hypothetical protein n=1 Tax=Cupriavidus ulmosensis TaxID=3065913 RepID=UPI00296AC52A
MWLQLQLQLQLQNQLQIQWLNVKSNCSFTSPSGRRPTFLSCQKSRQKRRAGWGDTPSGFHEKS